MTFQRKVSSVIQHKLGKELFCSSPSLEVSFDRITYSKFTAHTLYHTHANKAVLGLSFLYFCYLQTDVAVSL